jgi:hypothetical protein
MVKNRVKSENLSSLFSLQNHNLVCVKFAASIFLVGLAFRLVFWDSFSFSSFVEIQKLSSAPPPLPQTETKTESSVFSSPLEAPKFDEFQVNNKSEASLNGKRIFFYVVFVNKLFILCFLCTLQKCCLNFLTLLWTKIKKHPFCFSSFHFYYFGSLKFLSFA